MVKKAYSVETKLAYIEMKKADKSNKVIMDTLSIKNASQVKTWWRWYQEDAVYIDWEHPEANTIHLALEVTCQNGQDEFRPDIVIFVNGLPLSYIEVKQPNAIRDGKTGIQSEQDRTRYRFENRKFRRFNNITQLIALSDNLSYISGQSQQYQSVAASGNWSDNQKL